MTRLGDLLMTFVPRSRLFLAVLALAGSLSLASAKPDAPDPQEAAPDDHKPGQAQADYTPPASGPYDGDITAKVSRLLANLHFLQQSLDDTVSQRFLDRYLEDLDFQHLHFLQSDVEEFQKWATQLDDMSLEGDTSPAYIIFKRYYERVAQRVAYAVELLDSETFEFTSDDSYALDRSKLPRPATLEEARQLWKDRVRYEVLNERLNDVPLDEIKTKLERRYNRLLRAVQEFDADDIFRTYLSSLCHVYDPHSEYLPRADLDNFEINMKLSLVGIGAVLRMSEDGYCTIDRLIKGGPAFKQGELKEGDRIVEVAQDPGEAVDVVDMKLGKVVEMIRGEKGTKVLLTVIGPAGSDKLNRRKIEIIRDEVPLENQAASARIIDRKGPDGKPIRLGIIDLPSFYADFQLSNRSNGGGAGELKSTTTDVSRLLWKLKKENVRGLILDLRFNGGGALDEAIKLTGRFIPEGPVVQVKYPIIPAEKKLDTEPSVLYSGPLLVLTSRNSASASEILAGALQDYDRALIVGDSSTHGKGTVQTLIQLNQYLPRAKINPGALKLTVQKFYRPSGSSTQLKGVAPDIKLPSLLDYRDTGETALDNPLPWDEIEAADFTSLNMVKSHLSELRKRSDERIADDQDFKYLRDDIAEERAFLAHKTVSLNEETRRAEAKRLKEKEEAREAERKARAEINQTIYKITLEDVFTPGLPEPSEIVRADQMPRRTRPGAAPETDPADESEAEEEEQEPSEDAEYVDFKLNESLNILTDYIALRSELASDVRVAEGSSPPAKPQP